MAAWKLIQSLAGSKDEGSPEAEDARLDALKEVGGKAALAKDLDLYQTAVRRMKDRTWRFNRGPAAIRAAEQLAEQANPLVVDDEPDPGPPPPSPSDRPPATPRTSPPR